MSLQLAEAKDLLVFLFKDAKLLPIRIKTRTRICVRREEDEESL